MSAEKVYGLMAEFTSAHALYEAAKKVRDEGFRRWDVYSPFPIHGMDGAMGLGKSILGYFVFCGGLTGAVTGLLLEGIPSWFLYPLIVQGKPVNFFSIPAFFPIIFELTILLSAFTAVIGMLVLNGLPRWNHPLFNSEEFKKVTDDGFFLVIESTDPKFSREQTEKLLQGAGAGKITVVSE